MRIAVVVPRYGAQIVGGAERHGAELAIELAREGHDVEICTSDAGPSRSSDRYACGVEQQGAVTVRRFAHRDRSSGIRDLDFLIQSGAQIGIDESEYWITARNDVPELQTYLADERFDVIIAIPLLAASTLRAIRSGGRVVVIPCLHDEPAAWIPIVRNMMASARGYLYNTDAEARLGIREFGRVHDSAIGGMGFRTPNDADRPDYSSTAGSPVGDGAPYVVYVGRWDSGKGLGGLASVVCDLRSNGVEISSVFVGAGPDAPRVRRGVVLAGQLDETAKQGVIGNALALCQPSQRESLSIVTMEAWLSGVPVITSSWSEVVRDHVTLSRGGLHYATLAGLRRSIALLLGDPVLRASMASAGRDYVLSSYSWESVMQRVGRALERFTT